MNSELNIKCTIWEKETFELIDYYSNNVIETKFKVNSSGVISRDNKQITFIPGENIDKESEEEIKLKIKKKKLADKRKLLKSFSNSISISDLNEIENNNNKKKFR